MNQSLEAAFDNLRREYVAEAPGRVAELRKDVQAFGAGEPDAAASLRTRFHRLAGSGGSYGFPEISDISRELERWLKEDSEPEPTPANIRRLEEGVDRIAGAFNAAAAQLGVEEGPARASEFGWRSLLIAGEGALRSQIERALEGSGFLVRIDSGRGEPQQVPVTERPDLVVIVLDSESPDPYAAASAWSAAGAARPRAIVLVDAVARADQVRAIAAGIDLIIPGERAPTELPTYAKTLARIGSPPSRVLLVENDDRRASTILTWLEQANVRVSHCKDGVSARELLARETPDLVLMDTRLPGIDGLSLARLVRQDPRYSLIPIVFLTAQDTVAAQIEALRAGADHFLIEPVDQGLLSQLVINRAERGRRIREMVHRDGLTGLLNHATLMAELEHAVEYARRQGESFAFIMVDVDHFKRVNDKYGHLVGDQVLLHVAKVFQSTARASDLIGRYGGEEFGLILRRTDRGGGSILCGKLRQALNTRPAVLGTGEQIPVRVCMGIAIYPEDAGSAASIALEADKALYRAKAGGRDRIESAEHNLKAGDSVEVGFTRTSRGMQQMPPAQGGEPGS